MATYDNFLSLLRQVCDAECAEKITLATAVTGLFIINALFFYAVCAPKHRRELTPVEILTVRLDSLQKEIVELMAHKIIHTDILSELSDTRETVADLRREFRQKLVLLTEGLEMVDTDKFSTWVKTLKSKMNIL
jgi:hypothetical protein